MTITDSPQARTSTADYATVRNSVGVYPITAPLVRVTGDDRLELLDGFGAKSAEFVEPDTVREVLALNEDGSPFAILLQIELDEVTWLLPRTPVTAAELQTYLDAQELPADVTVEIDPAGWGATAFEGPRAWAVAEHFVDFDISGLTLHGITPVESPNIGGALDGATAHLARVGTTGEYGYLLLSDAPAAAHDAVLAHAVAQDGAAVGHEGLARVQSEAGMPVYHAGFGGLSVNEADLAWMVDWQRIGEFHGSAELVSPTAETAKLVGLVAEAGVHVEVGAAVTAGGVEIGTVVAQTPSANPAEELVFALVESPFWVPGLDLEVVDAHGVARAAATTTAPRVIARSLHERIG